MGVFAIVFQQGWISPKVFANKTSHFAASWYRPPGGASKDFQLFHDQLDQIRN